MGLNTDAEKQKKKKTSLYLQFRASTITVTFYISKLAQRDQGQARRRGPFSRLPLRPRCHHGGQSPPANQAASTPPGHVGQCRRPAPDAAAAAPTNRRRSGRAATNRTRYSRPSPRPLKEHARAEPSSRLRRCLGVRRGAPSHAHPSLHAIGAPAGGPSPSSRSANGKRARAGLGGRAVYKGAARLAGRGKMAE